MKQINKKEYLKDPFSNIQEIRIGNQIWMSSNLNVSKFCNGEDIIESKNKTQWIKACEEMEPTWCYPEFKKFNSHYGKLYNWFAINNELSLVTDDWKIPEESDWEYLIENLGGTEIAGKKMKENNSKVGNSFNAQLGSFIPNKKSAWINGIDEIGAWWSKTIYPGSTNAIFLILEKQTSRALLTSTYWPNAKDMTDGLFVRCLKSEK